MTSLSLKNRHASLIFPRSSGWESTHLGIGAHADDLEIMAYHGIAHCFESEQSIFSGITVTDGVGSPQNETERLDQEKLRTTRQKEQKEAAELGRYGFMAQLDYSSSGIKGCDREQATEEIFQILKAAQPEVVYLHQPGDKHPTHLAVLAASVAAIKRLPPEQRPQKVYGCEVWRDLDWLPDDQKIYLPTDRYPKLAHDLIELFQSQISAGVAYHHGTLGRRSANATFADPHFVKKGDSFTLAVELMPVINDEITLQDLALREVERFRHEVESSWEALQD